MRHKCRVEAICHPISCPEASRGSHVNLLLEQEALRAGDDCVLVLRKWICSIANLLHLVINPARVSRLQFEPCAWLYTVESWLAKKLRAPIVAILCYVVHDLERRSPCVEEFMSEHSTRQTQTNLASEVQIDVSTGVFANGRQYMGTVVCFVCSCRRCVRGELCRWSWYKLDAKGRSTGYDRSWTLGIGNLTTK
jgi:hypothetical protein